MRDVMRLLKYKKLVRKRTGGSVTVEKYVISGGKKLFGEVEISGAKNAVAAILPATILSDEPCVIENIPNISDVTITLPRYAAWQIPRGSCIHARRLQSWRQTY